MAGFFNLLQILSRNCKSQILIILEYLSLRPWQLSLLELKHVLLERLAVSDHVLLLTFSCLLMHRECELATDVNKKETEQTRRVQHVERDVLGAASVVQFDAFSKGTETVHQG